MAAHPCAALYAGEHAIVRSVASYDMVFEDPSAPHEFGIPARLDKLESFLQFMKENLQGTVGTSFTEKYVSNDRVVLAVSTKESLIESEIPAAHGCAAKISDASH